MREKGELDELDERRAESSESARAEHMSQPENKLPNKYQHDKLINACYYFSNVCAHVRLYCTAFPWLDSFSTALSHINQMKIRCWRICFTHLLAGCCDKWAAVCGTAEAVAAAEA